MKSLAVMRVSDGWASIAGVKVTPVYHLNISHVVLEENDDALRAIFLAPGGRGADGGEPGVKEGDDRGEDLEGG